MRPVQRWAVVGKFTRVTSHTTLQLIEKRFFSSFVISQKRKAIEYLTKRWDGFAPHDGQNPRLE
jgi:hypothetical protein